MHPRSMFLLTQVREGILQREKDNMIRLLTRFEICAKNIRSKENCRVSKEIPSLKMIYVLVHYNGWN